MPACAAMDRLCRAALIAVAAAAGKFGPAARAFHAAPNPQRWSAYHNSAGAALARNIAAEMCSRGPLRRGDIAAALLRVQIDRAAAEGEAEQAALVRDVIRGSLGRFSNAEIENTVRGMIARRAPAVRWRRVS